MIDTERDAQELVSRKLPRPYDSPDGFTPERRWTSTEPMWKRVPTRCEDGHRTSDFMMLIPRLRCQPRRRLQATLAQIHDVLASYRDAVVFADVNLRLNLLWVSVRTSPGIGLELANAVQTLVPEAKLIANRAALLLRERARRRRWRFC